MFDSVLYFLTIFIIVKYSSSNNILHTIHINHVGIHEININKI